MLAVRQVLAVGPSRAARQWQAAVHSCWLPYLSAPAVQPKFLEPVPAAVTA
jgi:hypothetical protein